MRKNQYDMLKEKILREAIVKHLKSRRPSSMFMNEIALQFTSFSAIDVTRAVRFLVRSGSVKCYHGMYYV